MCILFVHVNPNPVKGQYRLVVASNRDENYKRPSKPLGKVDDSNIIGGLDMEPGREGGMQLGFRTKPLTPGQVVKHSVGVLLNMKSELIDNPLARGRLVRNYLETDEEFTEYVENLNLEQYNGFTLVGVEVSKDGVNIFQQTNKPRMFSKLSGKQTVGLSNSHPWNPFKKVTAGRQKFEEILEKNLQEQNLIDELFQLLKDKTKHITDDDNTNSNAQYSSICVPVTKVGILSRTHTVILIDSDWNFKIIEHAMEDPIDPKQPKWVFSEISYNLEYLHL